DASDGSRRISPLAYVLSGVGVLGLGAFTFFAITGKNEKDRLRDSCAPMCTNAEVNPVRARYIAADVSLGVSLVALGVAAYLFLAAERAPAKSSGLGAQ